MMKATSFVMAMAAVSCIGGSAVAQTRPGFEIGAQLLDYNYREYSEGITIVRDDGIMGGITLGYVETIGSSWFVRARFDAASGSIDYRSNDGSRLDGVRRQLGQLEVQLGQDFAVGRNLTLTPFVGFGARVLKDKSGGLLSEDGKSGYDSEIDYGYLPIGLAIGLPLGRGTRLTLNGQYNQVIRGEVKSKLSDVDPELPDPRFDLNGGHGLEASAIARMPVGRHAIGFGVFVRRWSIARSEVVTLVEPEGTIEFLEPKNRNTELGIRVSFSF